MFCLLSPDALPVLISRTIVTLPAPLQVGGEPLKWNLPIGVLFDLHGAPEQGGVVLDKGSRRLPLPVTVHFRGFPASKVLHVSLTLAHKAPPSTIEHFTNVPLSGVALPWPGLCAGPFCQQLQGVLLPHIRHRLRR
jgi:hypothetical protein